VYHSSEFLYLVTHFSYSKNIITKSTMNPRYSTVTVVILLLLHLNGLNCVFTCDLGRSCVALKDCPLVIQQLRLAQAARTDGAFGAMNRILESIRTVMCNVDSKNVCCPIYVGTVKMQNSRELCPVYALNSSSVRVMDWPVYGELDNIESYFWRDIDCIPFEDFEVITETASNGYTVEKSHMDLILPPTLDMKDARCLAIWKNDEYTGYGHLKLGNTDDVEDDIDTYNNVEDEREGDDEVAAARSLS